MAITLSIEDVIKESTNRTVPGACATPASNGLLERSISVAEKCKNGKIYFNVLFDRRGIDGYHS